MKLSIIIPAYNVEKYIDECIESIYRQGLEEQDFEVIIVNDGSTDATEGVVKKQLALHTNMVYISQDNAGVSVARNVGIAHAQGDWLAFVDGDDVFEERALGKLISHEIMGDVDIIQGGLVRINENDFKGTAFAVSGEQLVVHAYSASDVYCKAFDVDGNAVVAIYRRRFVVGNGICFPTGIGMAEDTYFTTMCYLKARKCVKTDIVHYVYRVRNNSCTTSISKQKIGDICTVLKMLSNEAGDYGKTVRCKIADNIFYKVKLVLWYVAHYNHLYREKKQILAFLTDCLKGFDYEFSLRNFLLKTILVDYPAPYVWVRHRLARRKW